MDLTFQVGGYAKWQAAVLLIPLLENEDILRNNPMLDNGMPWLSVAPAMRDLQTNKGELTLIHGHPDLALSRALFIGLGSANKFTPERFRDSIAQAVRHCQKHKFTTILLPAQLLAKLPCGIERLLEEAVYAANLSLYRGDFLKTATCKDAQDEPEPLPEPILSIGLEDTDPATLNAAALRGQTAANAVRLTRVLANTPANLLTPMLLAARSQQLAKEHGLSCKVLTAKDLQAEGMGAMLAVGQGSSNPPCLIILEHAPSAQAQAKPLVFIGKGLCFDSGGISLKPAPGMHHMKGDMAGAAAVLGALTAIAQEQIPRRVIGILACAENMPDGGATRPGDVVTGLRGDSIEIQNTDAEGRLVLCDALAYAQKYYDPAAMIDIATLTGACAVALGDNLAGLFSDDNDLATRIQAAGALGGEYYWPLPLWPIYRKKLKSEIADICHIATREGGAITAALFLQHFVDSVPWAHLDMASVDWEDKKTPLCPKGCTGFGCRTLLEVARGGLA
ncbi:MAG: leucyl aminopeptidase [Desulfovibrionaceae bacterium]|nr:leucyl aminopeptidase [Desulfovibrionaceae bacterium]